MNIFNCFFKWHSFLGVNLHPRCCWRHCFAVSWVKWLTLHKFQFSSVQLLSHVQLCDRMNCSTPGFPVHHQLQELAQTQVHWVGDAIQPSHPLRLLIFLLAILFTAYASSSLAFHMMYSALKLSKQGDKLQPWCTPFPVWNQSVVPCLVLTIVS